MSRPQSTGLVVPVDAARELVAPWQHLLPAAGRSLPPHVTALWPFLPVAELDAAAERRLEELLGGAEPFAFALTRVATLADASVLVPEPAEPFAALTRLLWDEWPECPPFGGAFSDIAPHVVVAIDPTAADRAAIEAGSRAAAAAARPAPPRSSSSRRRRAARCASGAGSRSAVPAPDSGGAGGRSGAVLERQLPADAELEGAAQRELGGHDVFERHPEVEAEQALVRAAAAGDEAGGQLAQVPGDLAGMPARRTPAARVARTVATSSQKKRSHAAMAAALQAAS